MPDRFLSSFVLKERARLVAVAAAAVLSLVGGLVLLGGAGGRRRSATGCAASLRNPVA